MADWSTDRLQRLGLSLILPEPAALLIATALLNAVDAWPELKPIRPSQRVSMVRPWAKPLPFRSLPSCLNC